ncbi:DUF4815 domain-containing protein [Sporosarcina sp. Marseille-Q4943]|uniref:DUF4815 domain-containing protein n=1 Tax=Sporosarcina sp. Marseille-Q4943 TaxID=2942204 RepID=UPI00208DB82C|nr:DUF4815 domain-containing protein [Sporosarcina sp. Marseille-Q4943]
MTKKYNRFDPADNWLSVDFVGGRRIQFAELEEMQSIALHRDKQLGDALFGSGHIVEGGQLLINKSKKEATVSPTRLYIDGLIHDLPETIMSINADGLETIGFKIEYKTITYEDDIRLLDPAIGFANFGNPGADRTVFRAMWVANDPTAVPMFQLDNGDVMNAKVPPEYEGITPILARRTHDASGSFLVSGMSGYIESKDENYVMLAVDAGKAYVQGFEILKPVPVRVDIPKSKEFLQVLNETKTYRSEFAKYALNSKPVKRINSITATVQVTKNVTRGNTAGTSDLLPNTPVVDIVEVSAGPTKYVKGVDYQQTGNTVDWSLSGAEPAGGTSYSVTFRYTKTMVAGVDYKQNSNDVEFLGGDRPVEQTTFQTTYEFYLARKDVYYLTENGDIKVLHGQPSIFPSKPLIPLNVLELGELYVPPNSDRVEVTNYKPKRLTMLDLRSLLDRLERAEYNQALNELDTQAQISDPLLVKKGIFTDNFTNFERTDVFHPDFDASIDPERKELTLPVDQTFVDLVFDKSKSTVRFHDRLVTMDYTEELLEQQLYATETMNVNPYMVFGNVGTIRLNPSTDIWVEESTVTRTVTEWWNNWWTDSRTETKVILDQDVQFLRQRTVEVTGEGFEPLADNIKATFDGIRVNLTPISGTEAGTQAGTIKADGSGKFKCRFTVPPNVRTGTREVRFYNEI